MNYIQYTAFILLLSGSCIAKEQLPVEIVTATGYPSDIEEVTASVEVIVLDEVQRAAATDIADILRFHAGIELSRNGGPGQSASLFLRGTESDHTLFLINGIAVNSASVGSAAIQHIDPQTIERIEIVKGPQSALWGSSAIGGVVNIITRKGEPGVVSFAGAIEGGGNDTYRGNALISGGNMAWQLNASVSHEQTAGFPSLYSSDIDRGYDNKTINLGMTFKNVIGEGSLDHWQTWGNNEYLDFSMPPLDQDFLNSSSSLSWNTYIKEQWQSEFIASYVRDRITQNQREEDVETKRRQLSWHNNFSLGDRDTLMLGVESTWEDVALAGGYSPYTSDSTYWEVFAQYEARVAEKHQIKLGIRNLDHKDAGQHVTWSLGYARQLGNSTRLVANAATGFKVPTTNERFGFGGNPDLKPEESLSIELAIKHHLAPGQNIELALFRTDIEEMIQWTLINPPWEGYNQNIARARIAGAELAYDLTAGPWSMKLGANWQDPIDKSSGEQLLRRARYNFSGHLSYDWNNGSLGTSLLYSGPRKDFGDITLDNYFLVNMDFRYALDPDWSLYGKVENLLDEEYELASGYRTQDRIGYIGIRYR